MLASWRRKEMCATTRPIHLYQVSITWDFTLWLFPSWFMRFKHWNWCVVECRSCNFREIKIGFSVINGWKSKLTGIIINYNLLFLILETNKAILKYFHGPFPEVQVWNEWKLCSWNMKQHFLKRQWLLSLALDRPIASCWALLLLLTSLFLVSGFQGLTRSCWKFHNGFIRC